MAMNLGLITTKIYCRTRTTITGDKTSTVDINVPNATYDNAFSPTGVYNTDYKIFPVGSGGGGELITENDYIDLGIVTDEREDLSSGSVGFTLPGTSAGAKFMWAIGGKALRISLSGIIPDGVYVPISAVSPFVDSGGVNLFTNASNSSVFRYKLRKIIAYDSVLSGSFFPNIIYYRPKYLWDSNVSGETFVYSWVVTGYSTAFIGGTRHISYTLTLEFSNNFTKKGTVSPRVFGDVF